MLTMRPPSLPHPIQGNWSWPPLIGACTLYCYCWWLHNRTHSFCSMQFNPIMIALLLDRLFLIHRHLMSSLQWQKICDVYNPDGAIQVCIEYLWQTSYDWWELLINLLVLCILQCLRWLYLSIIIFWLIHCWFSPNSIEERTPFHLDI